MTITIVKYHASKKHEWDDFVSQAQNGHFLFFRGYMDYHSHRFIDYSLMAYDSKKNIIALFPANVKENSLYSHEGLTFGGLIMRHNATAIQVHSILSMIAEFAKKNASIHTIIYKSIPGFYNRFTAQADLYALWRMGAKLVRRDVSSIIDLSGKYIYSKGRKWTVKKAKALNHVFIETTDLAVYWNLLEQVLRERHSAVPVHTIEEISYLRNLFPGFIRCYLSKLDSDILAGVVIYEYNNVAHVQYMSNSHLGRSSGALDCLIDHLLVNVYRHCYYFDFGISTEKSGLFINEGLVAQKEGFGARSFMYDRYSLPTDQLASTF